MLSRNHCVRLKTDSVTTRRKPINVPGKRCPRTRPNLRRAQQHLVKNGPQMLTCLLRDARATPPE